MIRTGIGDNANMGFNHLLFGYPLILGLDSHALHHNRIGFSCAKNVLIELVHQWMPIVNR
jgi:hypothetical protein